MDEETGEMMCAFFNKTDPETGEKELIACGFNKETGENEYYGVQAIWKHFQNEDPFKISRYLIQPTSIVHRKNIKGNSDETSTNFITTLVFLLPTVIFTPVLGFIVLTFGIVLHKWCHRQNAKLINKGENSIYYQSPFHTLYKEFCSKCIAEEEGKKMCKIQNMRYNKKRDAMKESLRRVVA